jgi:intracellular multiplication protein IcmM
MIGAWNKIKKSKGFYVITYRWLLKAMMISLALNVLLIGGIILASLNLPGRHYYATNGAIALMAIKPMELTPLDKPNYSSQALLPPDPPDEGTGLTAKNAI